MINLIEEIPFISVCLTVLLIVIFWLYFRRPKALPPGPKGLPLIGSPYLLGGNMINTFRSLHKQYGDVFTITAGHINFIIFNGYETLREAFIKRADDFSDRPSALPIVKGAKGLGIANSSGYIWKHTRTFSLGALRDYGFGKRSMEGKIMEEVQVFLDIVLKSDGEPMTMNKTIHTSVSNVICSIVFGDRYEHDDPEFLKMLDILTKNVQQSGGFLKGGLASLPIFRYLPIDLFGVKANRDRNEELRSILFKAVTRHRETIDFDNPRDFIDEFLIEQEKHKGSENIIFSDDNLRIIITNLFFAGTETTSTTLCWAVLQLLHNPNMQDRIRHEIEDVVGFSRDVSLEDRANMPYTEAFITETMRWANIAPFSVPHGASKDISFQGYTIPKKSVIIMNLDSVMRDPELFENPKEFNPDRFMGKDGKLQGQEKVISFSLGRRVCLGEKLARMELFLFLTSFVQRFQLLPVDAKNLPTLEGILGVTHSSRPYHFRAVKI